jgi:hypothetical protein
MNYLPLSLVVEPGAWVAYRGLQKTHSLKMIFPTFFVLEVTHAATSLLIFKRIIVRKVYFLKKTLQFPHFELFR